MFEPVETIEQVLENVSKYQVAVKALVVRPSRVRAWYYIPSLDMVGAAEFIGYKDIRVDYFAESHVNPSEAERHLQATGWFRQLEETEPYYVRAYSLAESIGKMKLVHLSARFYVLKDGLDKDSKNR
jgi:hypothetical protein